VSQGQLAAIREALARLAMRLASGEIDESAYDQLRAKLTEGLARDELLDLGITPAPDPIGPSSKVQKTHLPRMTNLDFKPGTVLLEQFRIVEPLGRGGFGAVFEAEDVHLGERLAVKVLDPQMVAREDLLRRFRREVAVMRRLVHPRVVRVFDYREDSEHHVALISMELVKGGSVRDVQQAAKERGEPVPVALALTILGQVLEALAAAHRRGVIHRDVTPGNILLAGGTPEELLDDPLRDPSAKLVDFGIAGLAERTELSQKSRVLGTPAYVAPEVLDPEGEISAAADVYGAGAVAYHLLTGELPLGRFPPPSHWTKWLPEGTDEAVMGLLEFNIGDRPEASAAREATLRLVEEAVAHEGQVRQASALLRRMQTAAAELEAALSAGRERALRTALGASEELLHEVDNQELPFRQDVVLSPEGDELQKAIGQARDWLEAKAAVRRQLRRTRNAIRRLEAARSGSDRAALRRAIGQVEQRRSSWEPLERWGRLPATWGEERALSAESELDGALIAARDLLEELETTESVRLVSKLHALRTKLQEAVRAGNEADVRRLLGRAPSLLEEADRFVLEVESGAWRLVGEARGFLGEAQETARLWLEIRQEQNVSAAARAECQRFLQAVAKAEREPIEETLPAVRKTRSKLAKLLRGRGPTTTGELEASLELAEETVALGERCV